jgi:hypothetical protein
VGDLHFATYSTENFTALNPGQTEPGVGSIKLAFEIFDMDGFLDHIRAHGVSHFIPQSRWERAVSQLCAIPMATR